MSRTYKDVEKGQWFTCSYWNDGRPLLKVSNVTFYDIRTGEFVKFKDSIFDTYGNPEYNVHLVEEDRWLINGQPGRTR